MCSVVELVFCSFASETIQLTLAVATFLTAGATFFVAMAAFRSIREDRKRFVSSRSPVLKADLESWDQSQYKDKNERDLFSDNITLIIKNVGFALASNIRIVCKRAGKPYAIDFGNKLSCFDLEKDETRQLKCSCSELSREHLEKSVIMKTDYIGILGNKMRQSFELPIQYEGEYVTALTTYLDFGV